MVKTSIDKKGKYGRLLGELFLILKSNNATKKANIKSYNQTLVDEGHATYYDGGKR